MEVKVINEKCIQCGLCAEIAPEIFILPESGPAEVKNQPQQNNTDSATKAAESCPTEAIEIN